MARSRFLARETPSRGGPRDRVDFECKNLRACFVGRESELGRGTSRDGRFFFIVSLIDGLWVSLVPAVYRSNLQ